MGLWRAACAVREERLGDDRLPLRQYLAQCGVAVLVVDNRGSNFRGLAFEAPLAGHLGGVEIGDQCAAVEQLAAQPAEIDGSRVAITGGSYGGFMTLMSVIRRPDVFRCGRGDLAGHRPARLRHRLHRALPRHTRPTSRRPTPAHRSCPHAESLNGSVLVIHGAIDENVHLATRFRLRPPPCRPGTGTWTWSVLPTIGIAIADRPPHPGPPHVQHLLQGLGVELPAEFGTARGEAV